jgi:hypothetical protein
MPPKLRTEQWQRMQAQQVDVFVCSDLLSRGMDTTFVGASPLLACWCLCLLLFRPLTSCRPPRTHHLLRASRPLSLCLLAGPAGDQCGIPAYRGGLPSSCWPYSSCRCARQRGLVGHQGRSTARQPNACSGGRQATKKRWIQSPALESSSSSSSSREAEVKNGKGT